MQRALVHTETERRSRWQLPYRRRIAVGTKVNKIQPVTTGLSLWQPFGPSAQSDVHVMWQRMNLCEYKPPGGHWRKYNIGALWFIDTLQLARVICPSNFQGDFSYLTGNLTRVGGTSIEASGMATRRYVPFLAHIRHSYHEDVIKWKHFPYYWPFVLGIHQSPVNSRTKASDAELWCFLWSAPEPTVEQAIEAPVIWDASGLIMTSL